MKKNSTKNLRINSEVQKELAILISSEVKDPYQSLSHPLRMWRLLLI